MEAILTFFFKWPLVEENSGINKIGLHFCQEEVGCSSSSSSYLLKKTGHEEEEDGISAPHHIIFSVSDVLQDGGKLL